MNHLLAASLRSHIRNWQRSMAIMLTMVLALSFAPGDVLQSQSLAEPDQPAATVITVNKSADLNSGSLSRTCGYTSGVFVAATDGCTLRRALIEASARPQSDRPISIRFKLANNDPNKDLEVAGTWTLQINAALPPLKTQSISNKNGQVTINGDTQPGGRTTAPKIIVNTNDFSLQVESTNNVIRKLAFKGGGAIFLKEDGNLVEDIWMGLTDDGQSIHFRTPGNEWRMAGGGVSILSDNNIVQDNVISGAFAKAIDINSNTRNNTIQRNLIGTRADGTVPTVPLAAQCLRSMSYDPQNWYGGWGIALSGSSNNVLNNRIAGLHILQSANDTPPMAIEIFGANHQISGNTIGIDSAGSKVGVCGQGIKVSGSGTQILDNIIFGSRQGFEDDAATAIMASDTSPLFGQITVRRNLVDSGPGNVYAFGPGIPQVLQAFAPARITAINGTMVAGAAGFNSPCPGCLIDLYSDDNDSIGETLTHLGSATAGSNGTFSFALSQPLAPGIGIRTSSTTPSAGVIGSFGAGTTTRYSKLYLPMSSVTVSGPQTGTVDSTYVFTITVAPVGVTTPLTYTVNATDIAAQSLVTNNSTVNAIYTWATPGQKVIRVTVRSELGEVTTTRAITLVAAPSATKDVYLPMIVR